MGSRPLGGQRRKRESAISLKLIQCEDMDWIKLGYIS
jgi:hypothetical protein